MLEIWSPGELDDHVNEVEGRELVGLGALRRKVKMITLLVAMQKTSLAQRPAK